MKLDMKDVRLETKRGSGPGGQHRNKTDSCVVATHIPTGIQVTIDGRKQNQNKREALRILQQRLDGLADERKAVDKKSRRDHAIHNTEIIRTYDFKSGVVRDHRSGKVASLKDVLRKGKIDLLR